MLWQAIVTTWVARRFHASAACFFGRPRRTDATFELKTEPGRPVLVGRCIHCRRRIALLPTGEPLSEAGLEHIVPRAHGGADTLLNIAVACTRCNNTKGTRHDHLGPGDPTYDRVVATLTARRAERYREPIDALRARLDPSVLQV